MVLWCGTGTWYRTDRQANNSTVVHGMVLFDKRVLDNIHVPGNAHLHCKGADDKFGNKNTYSFNL
jgi:hypothetical protein